MNTNKIQRGGALALAEIIFNAVRAQLLLILLLLALTIGSNVTFGQNDPVPVPPTYINPTNCAANSSNQLPANAYIFIDCRKTQNVALSLRSIWSLPTTLGATNAVWKFGYSEDGLAQNVDTNQFLAIAVLGRNNTNNVLNTNILVSAHQYLVCFEIDNQSTSGVLTNYIGYAEKLKAP